MPSKQAHYHAGAPVGGPAAPASYPQQLVGSQTISRSSNLHKHYFQQQQQQQHHLAAAYNRNSIYYQQPAPAPHHSGYFYYDQPLMTAANYQVPSNQQHLYQQHAAHTLHRLSCYAAPPQPAAPSHMSLAFRAPKNRGPIPMNLIHQQQAQAQANGHSKSGEKNGSGKIIYQEPTMNLLNVLEQQARLSKPLCRCRVMYLGSSVPHITKNGLHGIQEPLRHLYPEEQFTSSNLRRSEKMLAAPAGLNESESSGPATISNTIDISHLSSSLGIDSWLSVWSNGLLLENVDEFGREIKRFYSIESLHYCAAVRFFDTTTLMQATNNNEQTTAPSGNNESSNGDSNNLSLKTLNNQPDCNNNNNNNTISRRGVVRFLPLDAPIFQYPGMMDANHPPVFAAIMRRTTGIKVLECHAFICRRDAAANALVRCCTHAYSDFLSAKRLSADFGLLQQQQASAYHGPAASHNNNNGFLQMPPPPPPQSADGELAAALSSQQRGQTLPSRRFRSTSASRRHHQKSSTPTTITSSSRAPLCDNGQYQVIETSSGVVKPTAGEKNIISKNKTHTTAEKAGRRAHRAANSTGTNSNELTHSEDLNSEDDEEEESCEEDNYAIIPKSNVSTAAKNKQKAAFPATPTREQRASSRERKRRHRRIKGSSRSLFNDFMPPPLILNDQLPAAGGMLQGLSSHELDIEKLSHSLDYLAMMSSGQQQRHKSEYDAPLTQQQQQQQQLKHPLNKQQDIMYSIVNAKSKRHSRSMQNLVQQQQQMRQYQQQQQLLASQAPPPQSATSGKSSEQHSSRLTSRGQRRGNSLRASQRRAASFQDILLAQQKLDASSSVNANGRPVSPSSFGSSFSRRSSLRSSGVGANRLSLRRTGSASNNSMRALNRRESSSSRAQVELRKSSFVSSTSEATNSRIYATCEDGGDQSSLPKHSSRLERCPDANKSRKGDTMNSRRASKSRNEQQLPLMAPESLVAATGYYAAAHRQSHLYNHLPAAQQAAAAIYMPAYYMAPPPPQQQQHASGIYSPTGGSLYDTITPPPAPFMPLPYVHHSPHYHPQLFAALPPGGLVQPNNLPHALHQLQVAPPPPSSTSKLATKSQSKTTTAKTKSKSATLATRFRCLSPPVNFFSSPFGGGGEAVTVPQRPEVESTGETSDVRQSNSSQRRDEAADQRVVSASEVVSATPGFISHTTATLGAPPKVAPTATTANGKTRMSWIKRLSISLSSSGGGGGGATGSQLNGETRTQASQVAPASIDCKSAQLDETSRTSTASYNSQPLGTFASVAANSQTLPSASELGGGHTISASQEAAQLPSGADQLGERQDNEPAEVGAAAAAVDGQLSADQREEDEAAAAAAASHQVLEEACENSTHEQQQPVNGKKKAKRGGLFSGALTLGRSAGHKRKAQQSKIVT